MPSYPPPPSFCDALLTVGVTGTNGKSSTVEWIAAALGAVDAATASISTVRARVGREARYVEPTYDGFLSIMRRAHERGARHAVIELTSAALALGFLRGWRCRVGVFTNLSHDHLDLHRSAEHYLASKAQLFVQLPAGGAAVLPAADPASALLDEVIPEGVARFRYGPGGDVTAGRIEVGWAGSRAELCFGPSLRDAWGDRLPGELRVPAVGDIYLDNALAALLAAACAGVAPDRAADAIARTPPPPGRFEVVARSPHVVIDYAHTPAALEHTLRIARALCRGRLWVVVGAGGGRDADKRAPMGRAAGAADRVLFTSDNPRREDPAAIAEAMRAPIADHPGVALVLDRRAAIAAALAGAREDDVVVIAGKGHEREQVDGEGARPFSDAAVVRELLDAQSLSMVRV